MLLLIGLRQASSPWLKRGGQSWLNLAAFIFSAASVGLALVSWSGLMSELALVANLIAIAGYLYLNGVRWRLLLVVALAMWLAVAVLSGSIGGLIFSSIGMIFAISAAWRLHSSGPFRIDESKKGYPVVCKTMRAVDVKRGVIK